MSEETDHTNSDDDKVGGYPSDQTPYQIPERYFDALGKFAHSFAETETALRYLLQSETQIKSEIFRAIYSNANVGRLITDLRTVLKATGARDFRRISSLVKHLEDISEARNAILHNAVVSDEAGILFAISEGRLPPANKFPASPETLSDMQADLETIRICFYARIAEKQIFADSAELPALFVPMIEFSREAVALPWRYKPS